jgi:hypothetical protein
MPYQCFIMGAGTHQAKATKPNRTLLWDFGAIYQPKSAIWIGRLRSIRHQGPIYVPNTDVHIWLLPPDA